MAEEGGVGKRGGIPMDYKDKISYGGGGLNQFISANRLYNITGKN